MDAPSNHEADGGAAIVLTDHHGPGKRAALAAFGAAALVLPAWDLWPGLATPGLLTLPVLVIILGAATVGGAFIAGAVLGESTELRVEAGGFTLARASLLRRNFVSLAREDLGEITIRQHEWDSRPPSYSVEVALSRGRPVRSGDLPARGDAQALATRLAATVGRSSP